MSERNSRGQPAWLGYRHRFEVTHFHFHNTHYMGDTHGLKMQKRRASNVVVGVVELFKCDNKNVSLGIPPTRFLTQ